MSKPIQAVGGAKQSDHSSHAGGVGHANSTPAPAKTGQGEQSKAIDTKTQDKVSISSEAKQEEKGGSFKVPDWIKQGDSGKGGENVSERINEQKDKVSSKTREEQQRIADRYQDNEKKIDQKYDNQKTLAADAEKKQSDKELRERHNNIETKPATAETKQEKTGLPTQEKQTETKVVTEKQPETKVVQVAQAEEGGKGKGGHGHGHGKGHGGGKTEGHGHGHGQEGKGLEVKIEVGDGDKKGKGLPPGLAKKVGDDGDGKGLPPGQAKKMGGEDGDDGKKVPPGQLKKELGLQDASSIAKGDLQEKALAEKDENRTQALNEIKQTEADAEAEKIKLEVKTEPTTTEKATDAATAVNDEKLNLTPEQSEKLTVDEKAALSNPSTTDNVESRANAEAKLESSTPQGQAQLAAEKIHVAETKKEVKQDAEELSAKADPQDMKHDIQQLRTRLEELEAYEEGEKTAQRMRSAQGRSVPTGDDGVSTEQLKETVKKAETPVNPAGKGSWEDTLVNDCYAVLAEIQAQKQGGSTNPNAAITPGSIPLTGQSQDMKQGPDSFHGATPGGALGRMMEDFKRAGELGANISGGTNQLIQTVMTLAGAGDVGQLQSQAPNRPLSSFNIPQ